MRDIAQWAGITMLAGSDSPSLWTNILAHTNGDDYYGLVFHPSFQMSSKPAVSGNTYWGLPGGQYAVTEMISGTSIGTFGEQYLEFTGLPITLNAYEVAIYRFEKVSN